MSRRDAAKPAKVCHTRPMAPVTIRDVAAAAGVSTATVSRVLSGRRPVTPEVARVVTEASERLGYQVNTVARSLRTQETGTVGMVVPYISNPYFPAIVEGVERELALDGRQLLLCDSQGSVEVEGSRLAALVSRRVDGLLVIACDSTHSADNLARAAAAVPVVQIDRLVAGSSTDFVGTDNAEGVRVLVDHLHAAGARSFAFVSALPTTSSAAARLDAYRSCMGRIAPDSAERLLLKDFSYEWGQSAAGELRDGGLPDAVLCGADLIALGLLSELSSHGVRVPDEVLVTGYDDIGFASLSNPALTTMRQPVGELGAESVRLLRARLAHAEAPTQHRVLQSGLQLRASTGPR